MSRDVVSGHITFGDIYPIHKIPVAGWNFDMDSLCFQIMYVPLTLDEWIQLDKKRRVKISISDYEAAEEILLYEQIIRIR